MGLHGVVEVNKAVELDMAMSRIFEGLLAVPHLHERANDPFGFTVGLRPIDAGKLLVDTVLLAGFDKGMLAVALELLALIGIDVIDLIRTLGDHVLSEKAGGAVLGFIRQDVSIQFPREVIDGHKQVLAGLTGGLSLQ